MIVGLVKINSKRRKRGEPDGKTLSISKKIV